MCKCTGYILIRFIMNNIAERYHDIRTKVHNVALHHQRLPEEVTLLAVSKTISAVDVRLVADAGCQQFAENYVQEAVAKIKALSDLSLIWHFIGPIQSNKTQDIATHFDWVHSIDRIKIAKRLNAQRPEHCAPLQVCIQVNISNDPQKSGVALSDVDDFARALAPYSRIQLRGLMAIPAAGLPDAVLQQQFFALKTKQQTLQQLYPRCDMLSLGMSDDMELAVACGSTMVRIGTAIFGKRIPAAEKRPEEQLK